MRKDKNYWIVDIGDESTKILRGSQKRERQINIDEFYLEKTLNKKMFIDQNPEVMKKFSNCFKSYTRSDQVTLLLKDPKVLVESFEIKPVSQMKLEEVVYWKMNTAANGKLNEWTYDFIAKERFEVFEKLGVEEQRLDVVTVMAEKQFLIKCQKVFKKCGIRIQQIQPQFLGFGKLLENSLVPDGMVLDLGCTSSCLYQYRNGMLKHKVDIIPDREESLDEYLNLMMRIIENRVQLFQDKRSRQKTKLYLIGGGNLVSGIAEFFIKSDKWDTKKFGELAAKIIRCPEKLSEEAVYLFAAAMAGFAAV